LIKELRAAPWHHDGKRFGANPPPPNRRSAHVILHNRQLIMKRAVLFLLIVLPPAVLSQHIVINEVMSSNQTALFDENGDASDWIELYNPGGEPANLSGYGLSDDPLDSLKWRFGNTVMPAGGYLIVFASDKNRHAAQLHTNFKIARPVRRLCLQTATV